MALQRFISIRRGISAGRLLMAAAICVLWCAPCRCESASSADSAATPSPSAPVAEVPLELQPYRHQLLVTFVAEPAFAKTFRRGVMQQVASAATRSLGQLWQTEVRELTGLYPATRIGLERLKGFPAAWGDGQNAVDQYTVLTVEMSGNRYVVSARAWDTRYRAWSETVARTTENREVVGEAAFRAACDVFRPFAEVERIEDDTAELCLQGGEFLAPDPTFAPIQPGDCLQPAYLFFDRDKVLQKVQPIPWTYLRADDVRRGRVSCTVLSGLRGGLGGSNRRRVKLVAYRVRPLLPTTVVRLVSQRNSDKPQIGLRVTQLPLSAKEPADNAEKTPVVSTLSDRHGQVVLQRQDRTELLWLYVRSGQSLLSRVPILPGVQAEVTLRLIDDRLRLGVEGELALMQSDIIEVVAQRATLSSQIRRQADKDDWAAVDLLEKQLNSLPDAGRFQTELKNIRIPAIAEARSRSDRLAEARINKLCVDTDRLITEYLNPRPLKDLKEEIRMLRKSSAAEKE